MKHETVKYGPGTIFGTSNFLIQPAEVEKNDVNSEFYFIHLSLFSESFKKKSEILRLFFLLLFIFS